MNSNTIILCLNLFTDQLKSIAMTSYFWLVWLMDKDKSQGHVWMIRTNCNQVDHFISICRISTANSLMDIRMCIKFSDGCTFFLGNTYTIPTWYKVLYIYYICFTTLPTVFILFIYTNKHNSNIRKNILSYKQTLP